MVPKIIDINLEDDTDFENMSDENIQTPGFSETVPSAPNASTQE